MTSLAEIVRALSDPRLYPDATSRVEVVQTQMSVVFLADDFVYKLKKPVNLGYLDYTTLEKRHFFSEQEVRLNRRLCPETYLEVVPVRVHTGAISLGGPGEAIEYAVKMRKLPRERMMDVLLAKAEVTPAMVGQVAVKVADFHQRADTSPEISKLGNLETVAFNTEENFSQTDKYTGRAISPEQYQRITDFTRGFLRDRADLFQRRVTEKRIRDCHGDLHTQHVCFTDGICIYDCIEFNDRFRYVDVAAEVSFLAMDLDRWGKPELAQYFVEAYVDRSGDRELKELVNFYKCYYAYVRAKVNCFRLDDAMLSEVEKNKALTEASNYFRLAEGYSKNRPD